MKTIRYHILTIAALFFFSSLIAQTEWRLVSDSIEGGSVAFVQNPTNTREFIYRGQLGDDWFKISNGTVTYVPLCREVDPLGQILDTKGDSNSEELGFRIRYSENTDYYKITLTTSRSNPTIIAEKMTPPEQIFLIGGPVNTHDPNWQLYDAKSLEKDPNNPFIFYYKGFLRYNTFGEERGSIKFLTGLAWDPAYHPYGSVNVPLAQAAKMRYGGADTKWTIPEDRSGDGYYVIKLNTFDETISILEFDPNAVYYPDNIYITGTAVPCGWTNLSPETMTKIYPKGSIYTWTGKLSVGEFKFLKDKGTWGSCYVATTENEPVVFGNEHDIVYEFEYWTGNGKDYKFTTTEASESTIQVDLSTMKMTVNKANLMGVDKNELLSKVTIYSKEKKLIVKNEADEQVRIRIFRIDGREVVQRTFNGDIEIPLNPGLYVVELTAKGFSPLRSKTIVR